MPTKNAWQIFTQNNGVNKCPPNMLIQKLSQTWPQGVHCRKKYCLQVCPPKIATKMAQAWQAEIHDKKITKQLFTSKGKKIYSSQKCSHTKYLACLYCSGFSELLDLEQRLFHAGLLLFKMAQFHFTHSKKFWCLYQKRSTIIKT